MLETILSSDSHIIEPPDLWATRLPTELRERGPQVRTVEAIGGLGGAEKADYWFVDGVQITSSFAHVARPGQRFEVADPRDIPLEVTVDSMRGGEGIASFGPERYIRDNLADHITGLVLYPTAGMVFNGTPDSALLSAIFRAYNDFVIDFCSYDRNRLKAIALINVDDIDLAVAEMRRVREAGLVGISIPVTPLPDRPYNLPEYEPLWAAAADLGLPVSLHLGSNRLGVAGTMNAQAITSASPVMVTNSDILVRTALAQLIFAGVFERHPGLKVGAVEFELGWIPFFLERLDYTYTQRPHRLGWHRFKDGVVPSDFWRSNCFASFQEDSTITSGQWERVGVETLMFGSDYPHVESTFPRSTEILGEIFAGVDETSQRLMTYENTKLLYGFEN